MKEYRVEFISEDYGFEYIGEWGITDSNSRK